MPPYAQRGRVPVAGRLLPRWRQTVVSMTLLLILHLCGLSLSNAVLGQPPGVLRETVSLEVSAVAARRLAVARELVATGDWRTLLDTLAEIRDRHRGELIARSNQRFVSVELGVRELIASLPPAGIEAYRSRHEPLWAKRLELALDRDDEVELQRIAEDGFGTLSAMVALQSLANQAWELGDLERAADCWRRLSRQTAIAGTPSATAVAIPTSASGVTVGAISIESDPNRSDRSATTGGAGGGGELSAAQIAARLILVDIMQGDALLAQRRLTEFQQNFPTQSGRLAGLEGPLALQLQGIFESSQPWKQGQADWSWSTAGGGVTRNSSRIGDQREVGPIIWSRSIAFPRTLKRLRVAEQVSAPQQPGTMTVSTGKLCFVQELNRVRSFSARNGAVSWPVEPVEPVNDSSSEEVIDDGTIYAASSPTPLPELSVLGEEFFAPMIAGDDLISVIGMPIGLAGSRESRGLPMHVVCLDIGKQEGKLRWTRELADWLPGGNWRISGPGLAINERIYFPIRQGKPNMAVGLVAVNRQDGTLVWKRTLCGVLSTPPTHYHIITSDQVSLGDGRLYVRTAGRATCCVDPSSGEIEWVTIDDPVPPNPDARIPDAELSGLSSLVDRGTVTVVQSDRQTVQTLDGITGTTLWKRKLPSTVMHLMGTAGGVVVLAGDQLWGVETSSGAIRWRFGFDDVEGGTAGHGLILGDQVLWPLSEELFIVNLLTGLPQRRLPLRQAYGLSGGHLSLANQRLLLSSPGRVTAFELIE